jgi:hypothetical protein
MLGVNTPVAARLALGLAAAAALLGVAQAAPADDGSALSGYWKPVPAKTVPAPALTPWARAQMKKVKTKGDVDLEAVRWCVYQGLPYIMDNAGPIEIRRSPYEFVVASEQIAVPRHIYTSIAKHPSEDVFDNTVVGNSLGKWASGVLTVDTVGLKEGVGPAGAPRTGKSHVVEHFRLADGGKRLLVTATWTDPKVFAKPYTYTLAYERLPDDYTPPAYYCDPRNNGVGHKVGDE